MADTCSQIDAHGRATDHPAIASAED